MADILHRVGIQASPDKVYCVLSDEKVLAGWWTWDVQASPKVGTIEHFRFDDRGFSEMKVLELAAGKRVTWHLCVWAERMDRHRNYL
jgi:uncharacterized protein YndB with AHSA1/START domain